MNSLQAREFTNARERLTATINGRALQIEEDLRRRKALMKDLAKRIRNLIGQLAARPSESIALALRDLEEQASSERSAIERLGHEVRAPLDTVDDQTLRRYIHALGDRRAGVQRSRAMLSLWFAGGTIRLEQRSKSWALTGALRPAALILPDMRRGQCDSSNPTIALDSKVWAAGARPG